MRWRLDIAYDGTEFHGWAAQRGLRTVQGELELWLGRILTLPEPAQLTVAGRTDAGVHARGQVAHVDLPDSMEIDPVNLRYRLNRVIGDDIEVKEISPAPEGFDARFAATARRYCYRTWDTDSRPDPLLRRSVLAYPEPLDVELMDQVAKSLLGLRDFVAFSKYREGATTIRTLLRFDVIRTDDPCRTIEATVMADAFTHSMVRSLMGAITQAGSGKRDATWLAQAATQTARCGEIPVLPARGLTLEEVSYPPDDQLTKRATQSRAMRSPDELCNS
jgi:tRNA pseudouridine38-40 synthase